LATLSWYLTECAELGGQTWRKIGEKRERSNERRVIAARNNTYHIAQFRERAKRSSEFLWNTVASELAIIQPEDRLLGKLFGFVKLLGIGERQYPF
jgi:hypothetical protein